MIWNTCCAKLGLERPRSGSYHGAAGHPKLHPLARHSGSQTSAIQCYNCGGLGHIAKRCTVAHRTTLKEAEGDTKSSGMAMLTGCHHLPLIKKWPGYMD